MILKFEFEFKIISLSNKYMHIVKFEVFSVGNLLVGFDCLTKVFIFNFQFE